MALDGNRSHRLSFYAFDLLHLDGEDLRRLSIEQRRARLRALLASGEFVTAERIRNYSIIFLLFYMVSTVAMVATSSDNLDVWGRPLGTDFSNVYTAGLLAAQGRPLEIYDPAAHFEFQRQFFYEDVPLYGWHYPPMFLAVARVLAELSYIAALGAYMLVTFAFYLFAVVRLLPRRETLLVAAAFPAVFVCLGHGQNAFLSAALLAVLFAELDRRPAVAGFALGLLTYKPQFGALFPLALLLARRWAVFGAATITTLVVVAATVVAWQWDIWSAFAENSSFTSGYILEQGATGWEKIQTVFSGVRMWGAPIWFGYLAQAISAVIVGVLTMWVWRREDVSTNVKGAVLIVSSLLVTPYFLDYDLVVLALPITLMVREGLASRFLPYEKTMLVALWVLPLVSRVVGHAKIPLTPIVLTLFLLLLWRNRLIVGRFSSTEALANGY